MLASRLLHLLALVPALVAALACSVLVDGSDYEDAALSNSLMPLGAECASCLETSCRYAFNSCEQREECTRYASCRASHVDPAGHWACGDFDPDFAALLRCTACTETCGWGEQKACVGRYVWPRPESDEVRWRQRLLDTLDESKPFAGVSVEACPPRARDCPGSSVASSVTDEQGWYELSLPVQDTPAPRSAGFRGIVRVMGEDIPTYQLQFASPVFTDSVDTLRLLNRASLPFFGALGFAVEPGKAHIVFQVFDCMRTGAEGIVVEISPEQPGVSPVFVVDARRAMFTLAPGTAYTGDGIGMLMNVDPEQEIYSLTFRQLDTGRVFAHAAVSVAADELSLVQVDPGPSTEVEPW